MKELMQQFI